MEAIIRDASSIYVRIKIWQADNTYVERTILGPDVLYWARTRYGQVLFGYNRDGLNAISGVLAKLDDDERNAIQFALDEVANSGLHLPEIEVELGGKEPRYRISYRDVREVVWDDFTDVVTFLRRTRGYSQEGNAVGRQDEP